MFWFVVGLLAGYFFGAISTVLLIIIIAYLRYRTLARKSLSGKTHAVRIR